MSCSAGGSGLVAAINAANAAGGGTINLAAGCTYSLTAPNNSVMGSNGLPVVVTPIIINGKNAAIAGNSTNFRIIAINGISGGALTLNGVTITGGHVSGMMATGAGGGILNLSGTLTLNSAVITNNFASDAGGGIANGVGATATLNNSESPTRACRPWRDSQSTSRAMTSAASGISREAHSSEGSRRPLLRA